MHLILTVVPLLVYATAFLSAVVVARGFGRLAFEGDEAMGLIIVFATCGGVFLAANVVLWMLLPVIAAFRKRS